MSKAYEESGVNIQAGYEAVERITSHVERTLRKEVLGGLGGFGATFDLSQLNMKAPVLVSGTDGVGTKLKLAIDYGKHDTIGIDAVAMCVNDILTTGAEPLYFLDYIATNKVVPSTIEQIVKGISDGCEQTNTALIGGETAEMPGMYEGEDYDLAGFCVGVVEQSKIIDGSKVKAGDVLIGVASSGAHSNGYSLLRKILDVKNVDLTQIVDGRPLADAAMEPTRIYVKPILELLKSVDVHAMAHITGGGLPGNLPRVLPNGAQAVINESSWEWPELFKLLQKEGGVEQFEMYRTFNCGVGMVLAVDAADADKTVELLNQLGEKAWAMGHIVDNAESVEGADEKIRVIFA